MPCYCNHGNTLLYLTLLTCQLKLQSAKLVIVNKSDHVSSYQNVSEKTSLDGAFYSINGTFKITLPIPVCLRNTIVRRD